ncbi:uncharacterized protein ACA1_269400 [Acanthamoeba castellanii str. Neff]|uniref:Securin n=1 Tax=Acanthamoeba castellanii (strain ATCC 30010 / Neff) TaxID=1257118 RepID=L8H201_ACACF|nr:uncharacterized protein ACA1_269400 [Acanthamoeba castellanii str. Neff]ELR19519.1 hypothetical protein ACA1_269400 [Acanthamoeba castellanii str. Neff]
MATMIHFDSPMLARAPAAEKENNLAKMHSKNGGGKGEQPMQRKRMALKAVNGENLSVSKLSQQTPKTGRVALSNLTNTVSAQRTPKATHIEMVKPSGGAPRVATKVARPATTSTKRRVPDIEQPYPKKVVPIFEDAPRLPKNWTNGLSIDIWTGPAVEDTTDFDQAAKLNVAFEPMPYDSSMLEFGDVPLLDDLTADLNRDLGEDAKSLAAELLELSWTLDGALP